MTDPNRSSYDIDLVDKAGSTLPSSQPNWTVPAPSPIIPPPPSYPVPVAESAEEAEDDYELLTAAELTKITNDYLTQTADEYFDEIMSGFNDKVEEAAGEGQRWAFIDEAEELSEEQVEAKEPLDEVNTIAWTQVSEKIKPLGFTTEIVEPDAENSFYRLRARW